MVAAVGAPIFAQKNILVAMHDFDAPVFAVEREQLLRRRLVGRQAGDQIRHFFFRWLPYAFLFALNDATYATDLAHSWPVILNVGSFDRKNINDALLDAAMRFIDARVMMTEGEKPAV
jgi:hypothetical protein